MIKPTIKTISLLAALALVLSSIATVTAAEQPIPKPDSKPADMSKPVQVWASPIWLGSAGLKPVTKANPRDHWNMP
jgi:hypothetical protein